MLNHLPPKFDKCFIICSLLEAQMSGTMVLWLKDDLSILPRWHTTVHAKTAKDYYSCEQMYGTSEAWMFLL